MKYPAVPTLTEWQKQLFWSKVEVRSDTECWPWLGARGRDGRGQVRIDTVCYTASRVALSLSVKQDLVDLVAKHSCDNPPCCNPRHLSAATQSSNIRESGGKGRRDYARARGEAAGGAKLTSGSVEDIRARIVEGVNDAAIARQYGVDASSIRNIRIGKTWRTT